MGGFVFLYLPLLLLMFFSFNRSESGSFPVTSFSLHWYRRLGEEFFVRDAFVNSLLVAAIATAVAVPVGTLCAFGLVRGRFRGKGLFLSLILMPMVVPGLLIGIALLIVLVPIFQVGLSLGTIALCFVIGLWPGLLAAGIHAVMYVFVLSSSINGLCHHVGYKNFDNTATNIRFIALLTGGEGLHNNHHGYPRSPKFSWRKSGRGEIDPAWPVIKLLIALHLAKPYKTIEEVAA